MILRGASSGSKVKKTTITKDEKDPAVVFFPTNQDSECMDEATGEQKNDSNSSQVGLMEYGLLCATFTPFSNYISVYIGS